MRITQSTPFLSSILPDVIKGVVLPAAMQRPYVWTKKEVLELFDSILREFPIGGFLSWQPGSKADLTRLAKVRLGPIEAATSDSAFSPNQLMLDGQNRLATLAWALMQDKAPELDYTDIERDTWLSGEVLVLDGKTRSIIFVPEAEANQGLRLPAWTLSNASSEVHGYAMRLIRQKHREEWSGIDENEVDNFIRFWDDCCSAFRNARIVLTVIENASAEEAKDAFLRICRVGVAMSEEDFDKAVQWAA